MFIAMNRFRIVRGTDVVAYGRRMVNAGVILLTSSPAYAHHDTVGGGAAIGGSSLIGIVRGKSLELPGC